MNYPEQQMLKILNRDLLSNPMYVINNLHIYDWESDFLAITRSLYAYEVEVKMSKCAQRAERLTTVMFLQPVIYFGRAFPNWRKCRGSIRLYPRIPFALAMGVCQYNMLTWKKRAISNVYADPAKEREKGVRAGAEAVRKSAWDAFRAQCPHIAFPYGKEFPMCDDHE